MRSENSKDNSRGRRNGEFLFMLFQIALEL
jgi:hypothetical protein